MKNESNKLSFDVFDIRSFSQGRKYFASNHFESIEQQQQQQQQSLQCVSLEHAKTFATFQPILQSSGSQPFFVRVPKRRKNKTCVPPSEH